MFLTFYRVYRESSGRGREKKEREQGQSVGETKKKKEQIDLIPIIAPTMLFDRLLFINENLSRE